MYWLVLGAGAIGSAVGGLLAASGETIWLLGRSWHLDPIRQNGLLITGILGEHRIRSLSLATRMEELPRIVWDRILVTVKSYDTASVAERLPELISSSALVVSLQNGLGNWETLAAHVPLHQLVGARVIFGVELTPGCASITVWGGDILLGALRESVPGALEESVSRQVWEVADSFCKAGLKTEVTHRIREALWEKVIYNCALNPLSSLLEVPYGELLKSPVTRDLMARVVEEAYAVASCEGLRLHPPTAQGYIQILFEELIPATASHYPSMLQDLKRSKPGESPSPKTQTEIEALNGALVRLGQTHRVPTPVNAFLAELIRTRESLPAGLPSR